MTRIILAINAGSSSVKVSIYASPPPSSQDPKDDGSKTSTTTTTDPIELAVAQIDGLTAPPATLKYRLRATPDQQGQQGQQDQSKKPEEEKKQLDNISTQQDAFQYILDHVVGDKRLVEIGSKEDIAVACHRVVHGGDYREPQVIDEGTMGILERLSDLAPFPSHRREVNASLPTATNIAFFDSSFHATIPAHIQTYPIDPTIAHHNQLHKYGFHGLSYAFLTRTVSSHLAKPLQDTNLILLHLGSGASACAVRAGKSLDTSMGLTPLDGLPGATRSGGLDPSMIFHFTHRAGEQSSSSTRDMHITEAEEILNKKSGWKALTGTTDFGEISQSQEPKCVLAFDIFVDRILGFVGSYFVKLEGKVDALVFAGGIGEKGAKLRERVVKGVGCLGFEIDEEKNNKLSGGNSAVVEEIGREGSRFKVLVCKTDEQLEMARGCGPDSPLFAS